MSKTKSNKAPAPQGNTRRVSLDELMRMMANDRVNPAIEKVTGWPAVCPGPAFPLVMRQWMSHPAFMEV